MKTLAFSFVFPFTALGAVIGRAPVVDLGYAKYYGQSNSTSKINTYNGIPFAQPPLGDLRWRKPQPVEDMSFPKHPMRAVELADACFQQTPTWQPFSTPPSNFKVAQKQSEDCLYMNILTPTKPKSKFLPVIVQIHGGGFELGDSVSYPGNDFVYESDGSLIYVEIQYRLALFGYLAGQEIQSDGTANAGLFDQQAALNWVQRHIGAFGGDPDRVTIWGGSAGGASVTYQMMAGGAVDNPPFSAAIAEYPYWQQFQSPSLQSEQYRRVLTAAGCSTLKCLRAVPSHKLDRIAHKVDHQSYKKPGYSFGDFYWSPTVDGQFIQGLPDEEFKKGRFQKVPMLVDRDQFEGIAFSNISERTHPSEVKDIKTLFPTAGSSFIQQLYNLYPLSNYPSFTLNPGNIKVNQYYNQRQAIWGDYVIDCPSNVIATNVADQLTNSSKVWKLVFNAGSKLHGATAEFLTSPYSNIQAPNMQLGKIMTNYFISFAKHYDPNIERYEAAPFWPSYVHGLQTLNVTAGYLHVLRDPDSNDRCDFWSAQDRIDRN